jgi:hypothetical protein
MAAIVMTAAPLPANENEARAADGVAVLCKPFLVRDAISLVRTRASSRCFGRAGDSPKAA